MRRLPILLALVVVACSSDSQPTASERPVPRPMPDAPRIRIIDGEVGIAEEAWVVQERVRLELESEGGAGRYQVEFWGRDAQDQPIRWDTSFPMNASSTGTESVVFEVDVPRRASSSPARVEWAVVLTMQASQQYIETSRFYFNEASE